MANYVQMGRSSYFACRDLPALLAWAAPRDVGVWHGERHADGTELVGIYMLGESWLNEIQSDAEEDLIPVDVIEELQQHIAEGWCVIIMTIGWEKLRYLTGDAWVVTPDRIESIDLTSAVMAQAKATGLRCTAPEY